MKHILYIGNKLMAHGQTATTIETLGVLLEGEGFKVYYASSVKSKFWRLCDMMGATIRRAHKADYVIIDCYGAVNFWYAFIISQMCRLFRIPYIPFLHGGDLPKRLEKSHSQCKKIFDHAYINVAPSGYLMDIFRQHGFQNLTYIPNTIEVRNYPYKERKNLSPKLLWVRAVSPVYNPKMAIDVLEQLRKTHPQAELCIVGPGKNGYMPEVVTYDASKQLGTKFTGRLSKPEWIALSADYDIFINTTRYDNMPVSVIEALALGLPVVSTNVGGIPYLIEDGKTALLVNSEDSNHMTSQILKLLENPEEGHQIAIRGRQLAESFDWPVVRLKWLEILK